MDAAQLAERLGRDDGTNLQSFSSHFSHAELKQIANTFGIETAKVKKSDLEVAVWSYVCDYDSNQERDKARSKAPSLMAISTEELLAAAGKLEQTVAHLRPAKGAPAVALWSADQRTNGEGSRAWISVDLRHHPSPALRRNGILEVIVDDGALTGHVEFRAGQLGVPKKGEVLLAAVEAREQPSLEVLFHKGGKSVQKWLDAMQTAGWDLRKSADDPRFPFQEVLDDYRKQWQKSHPLYRKGIHAQLGGWPLSWPDEAAEDQMEQALVLRTYRAAEPWVEVFKVGRGYDLRIRIT